MKITIESISNVDDLERTLGEVGIRLKGLGKTDNNKDIHIDAINRHGVGDVNNIKKDLAKLLVERYWDPEGYLEIALLQSFKSHGSDVFDVKIYVPTRLFISFMLPAVDDYKAEKAMEEQIQEIKDGLSKKHNENYERELAETLKEKGLDR